MSLPAILIVTGGMGAGKSTIAQALAERLPRSVHLRGDLFRRMIVNGQAAMDVALSAEAQDQLALRYDLGAIAADRYAEAGFQVIYQDIVLGPDLTGIVQRLRRWQPGVVVLAPSPETLAVRDANRAKTAYRDGWTADAMDRIVRAETPAIGLWLDTSTMTVDETVETILARAGETRSSLTGIEA